MAFGFAANTMTHDGDFDTLGYFTCLSPIVGDK